jgi:hypothetical protein
VSVTGWDGVTLTLEIALSAATSTYALWDTGIWDTSTWGPDVVWTDASSYVRSIRTDRAFSRGVMTWQSGSATVVLDDLDGRFNPANLAGPYVSGGVTQVRPMRPIRITAAYAGISYPVYRGYVTDWDESWSGGAVGKGDAYTTLTCADEFAILAGVDGLAVTPVGAGETTGARVHRWLDAAGNVGERDVDVGVVTVQATDLSADTLAGLEDTVTAEGGALYVTADGAIVFDGQTALIDNARSVTSQATFADDGTGLPYAAADVAYNSDLVINFVSFAPEGGTAQNVADATSRALYGTRRKTETALICETDAQALTLAQWTVQQYKDPELRFTRIGIKPRKSPAALWPQALGRLVRDQITVKRNPPGAFAITQACHIAGVAHDITPDDWTTTWPLWSATQYVAFAASRWDTGLFDSALFFF